MTTSDVGRPAARRRVVTALLVLAAAAVLSAGTLLGLRWAGAHGGRTGAQATARSCLTSLGFCKLSRPASAIDLPALNGHGTVNVTGLAGKPIVVNFWSSSCHPCQQETPALASVARAIGGKVSFVGVDTADLRGPAARFVARYKVPYPIAFDPKASLAAQYGLVGLPVTVFLSPSGKTELGENIGALTAPRLRTILRRLYGVS
jgi:thiol-disulfide isomerase/thioredoxin